MTVDTRNADARYEDGAQGPLALRAFDAEGVAVVSALAQDAVLAMADMQYDARRRRLTWLINRFRWEDRENALREKRPYERVRALLTVTDAIGVASQGIDRADKDAVLSLLAITWEPGADGAGHLVLTLAGDGAIRVQAECIDVMLRDVTRPYLAPSGRAPEHPPDHRLE